MSKIKPGGGNETSLRLRYTRLRNRILGSVRFQHMASRIPIVRGIARQRASAQFDLLAGFVYSQILFVCVETGLIDFLHVQERNFEDVVAHLGFSERATGRILRSAVALRLIENPQDNVWTLGAEGAALSANPSALAMVRHHVILYRDLADPVALMRANRAQETALSSFWTYASKADDKGKGAAPYSALMAATQAMVSDQIVAVYDFSAHRNILDIGGGSGAFVQAVAKVAPNLKLAIFDLPDVISVAQDTVSIAKNITLYAGNFKTALFPRDQDLITLVRILHDHDDAVAHALLAKVYAALPVGGKLLIVEPMAEIAVAPRMGDAYFGMYLWAMNSGRPRSVDAYKRMLHAAGFSGIRMVKTAQPVITSAIVAKK